MLQVDPSPFAAQSSRATGGAGSGIYATWANPAVGFTAQSRPPPSFASASKGVTLADLAGDRIVRDMPVASRNVARAPASRSGVQRQRADQDQERGQLLRSSICASLERGARGVPLTEPEAADNLDNEDVLRGFRKRFFIPPYDSPEREVLPSAAHAPCHASILILNPSPVMYSGHYVYS